MIPNLWRNKFNPDDDFVVIRKVKGSHTGDPLVKDKFGTRRLEQMYNNRMVLPAHVYNEYIGASSPAADERRVADSPAPVGDAPHPLDHDGDGRKGGARDTDDLQPLRDELEALGVNVDKRWGEKRLNEELEKSTRPALPGVTEPE